MKKIIPLVVISLLVLGTTLLWFMNSGSLVSIIESWHFVIILLIVAFATYILYSRLKSVRRGEPAEDELSKNILQRASAISYYVSLYLWVAMIVVNDRVKMDTEVLLGTGILGMAVIWIALVIFFKVRGFRNE
jgi:Ca2+/Na+ antiporter